MVRQPSRPAPPPPRDRVSPLPFAGMIGLACLLFLDLASLVVVSWPVVVILVVQWLILFTVACSWWSRHPRAVPWLPVVGIVCWALTVIVPSAVT